jgi:preprotein translocase subunit SecE
MLAACTLVEVGVSKPTIEPGQKPENAIVRYFKDTRGELRKVSWPTREQATNLTLIVLAVTAAMAVFLGAFDLLFATLIRLIVS